MHYGKVGTSRKGPYKARLMCPRCQTRALPVTYPGALSRVDNATEVCSECGLHEALTGLVRRREGAGADHHGADRETTDDWPVYYMPGGLLPTRA